MRVDVSWNLGVGGTGLTVLYGMDGATLVSDSKTFFNAIASRIPAGVVLTFPTVGDVIDPATGLLVSTWAGGAGGTVTGTGTGTWAAGVGASVRWTTAGIHNGHRVNGRTFLVPLNGFSYNSSGNIDTSTLTNLQTAAHALAIASSNNLQVWSRPTATLPGAAFPAVDGTVTNKVSTLRTRRT